MEGRTLYNLRMTSSRAKEIEKKVLHEMRHSKDNAEAIYLIFDTLVNDKYELDKFEAFYAGMVFNENLKLIGTNR